MTADQVTAADDPWNSDTRGTDPETLAQAQAGTGGAEGWYDDDAGHLVRPYAMTRGRTSPHHDLNLITIAYALVDPDVAGLHAEQRTILQTCRSPSSVAEIAAAVKLPLTVVKILLGDLIDRQYVLCRSPVTAQRLLNTSFLQVVLDGIEKI